LRSNDNETQATITNDGLILAGDTDDVKTRLDGKADDADVAKLEGGNTFDAEPQIMAVIRALTSAGVIIQDNEGNGRVSFDGTRLVVHGQIDSFLGTNRVRLNGGNFPGVQFRDANDFVYSGIESNPTRRSMIFTYDALSPDPDGNFEIRSIPGDESSSSIAFFIGPQRNVGIGGYTRFFMPAYRLDVREGDIRCTQLVRSAGLRADTSAGLPISDHTGTTQATITNDGLTFNPATVAQTRANLRAAAITPPARTDATASTALVLADEGGIVAMTSGSANVVSIPPNSGVEFPIGTIVMIEQLGAGSTTIDGEPGGITLNGVFEGQIEIGQQFGAASLRKIGADEWVATVSAIDLDPYALKAPIITETIDANETISPTVDGATYRLTLEASPTITLADFPSATTAATIKLIFIQDDTGDRVATFAGNVTFPGDVAPTFSASADAVDTKTFQWDGVAWQLVNSTFDQG